jgi:hypothetical protein
MNWDTEMIAQDALAGLEAGLITKAEALEQAGVEDIEAIRESAEERDGDHEDNRWFAESGSAP